MNVASAGASEMDTPMRPMPVSTLRCTGCRFPAAHWQLAARGYFPARRLVNTRLLWTAVSISSSKTGENLKSASGYPPAATGCLRTVATPSQSTPISSPFGRLPPRAVSIRLNRTNACAQHQWLANAVNIEANMIQMNADVKSGRA